MRRLQYYFAFFAVFVFCYAPISFMRTITFDFYWALLDQWMTVPWFGFVFAWALSLHVHERMRSFEHTHADAPHHQQVGAHTQAPMLKRQQQQLASGCAAAVMFAVVALSAASYPMIIRRHALGFEICIAIHLAAVLVLGMRTYF